VNNKKLVEKENITSISLIEKLKNEFINPSGIYPKKLIDKIIQDKELVTPKLLQILENFTNSSPTDISYKQWTEGIAALFILAKFREKKAFTFAAKLCTMPHHVVDTFLGDVTTEGMPLILASTFNGDIKSLCSIVTNQHLYEFSREAALNALVILFIHNMLSREKIISIFDSFFDELYDDFSHVPSSLVLNCCKIRATELTKKINKYYKANIIDESFVDFEHVERCFAKSNEEMLTELKKNYYYNLINNLEQAMGYLFRKEKDEEDNDYITF